MVSWKDGSGYRLQRHIGFGVGQAIQYASLLHSRYSVFSMHTTVCDCTGLDWSMTFYANVDSSRGLSGPSLLLGI